MQSLVGLAKANRRLTTKELFRIAYQMRFKKDAPDHALTEDARQYDQYGSVPHYVCEYLTDWVGQQP